MYLELRSPISVHVNVGYSLKADADTGKPNAPSIRVSKFLISTFKWQRKVMQGLCEGEKGGPYCMSQLGRLLGTSRIPTYGRDRLRFTPDSRHIVVIRHDNFFRVDVMSEDGGSIISQGELQRQLQHIIDSPPPDIKTHGDGDTDMGNFLEGTGVGILTMEDRNLWAHHREALKAESKHNRMVLSVINSALLVVCFDKRTPVDMTERSKMLLHGTKESICNRWFDKFQVSPPPLPCPAALPPPRAGSSHPCWHPGPLKPSLPRRLSPTTTATWASTLSTRTPTGSRGTGGGSAVCSTLRPACSTVVKYVPHCDAAVCGTGGSQRCGTTCRGRRRRLGCSPSPPSP